MKPTITLLLAPFIAAPALAQLESEEQLRNPAYLINKYNKLALQYNALVEKARQNLNDPRQVIVPAREISVTNPVNEGLERANADLAYKLRSAQSDLNQANQRKTTFDARNRFLEEENARLKDKLHEFRNSESELEDRSRRLIAENQRAKIEVQNFETIEKQLRNRIRELQGSGNSLERELENLEDELRQQIADYRESNAELVRENSIHIENQKVTDAEARDLTIEINRLTGSENRNLGIIENIQDENGLLLQKNTQLAQRNKELDVAVQLMDQEIQEISNMEQHLRGKLSEIDMENRELVRSIDLNRNERNELKDQIRDLEGKIAAYDRRNAELSGRLGLLRDQRVRLRNEIIDVIEHEDNRVDQ